MGSDTAAFLTIGIVLVWLMSIVGYGMNVYKFFDHDIDIQSNKPMIARGVGAIIAPVGAIEGYMTFDAEKTQPKTK